MNDNQPTPELRQAQERSWVDDMQEHYYRTGAVRPEDVYRVLGDTSKVVRVEPQSLDAGSHRPLFG
jgi:hypothetical protein